LAGQAQMLSQIQQTSVLLWDYSSINLMMQYKLARAAQNHGGGLNNMTLKQILEKQQLAEKEKMEKALPSLDEKAFNDVKKRYYDRFIFAKGDKGDAGDPGQTRA